MGRSVVGGSPGGPWPYRHPENLGVRGEQLQVAPGEAFHHPLNRPQVGAVGQDQADVDLASRIVVVAIPHSPHAAPDHLAKPPLRGGPARSQFSSRRQWQVERVDGDTTREMVKRPSVLKIAVLRLTGPPALFKIVSIQVLGRLSRRR